MTSPLTDDDRAVIDVQLKNLVTARDMINRAKAAGLDVQAEEEQVNALETQLKGIKASFFPTGATATKTTP